MAEGDRVGGNWTRSQALFRTPGPLTPALSSPGGEREEDIRRSPPRAGRGGPKARIGGRWFEREASRSEHRPLTLARFPPGGEREEEWSG